jgi:hypothetical protein
MTTFEIWFDKEYGNRPSARSITDLEVDAGVHLHRHNEARELLEKVMTWELMKDAAESAWQADKDAV